MRFDECLAFVLQWEGGYVHHPADRGGATNQGITQGVYDDWRIGQGLGRQPVSGLSGGERDAIYLERYWHAAACGELQPPLDLVVFDSAVNCGARRAAKWLQRATGVADDGAVGPLTLEAVGRQHTPDLVAAVLRQRGQHYLRIVERDASQKVFLKGWMNRLSALAITVGVRDAVDA